MFGFRARITSLTVGAKIAVILAVMMLPLGHLTWLFVQQVRKDSAFSSLKVTGARLLPGIWSALSGSTAPGAVPERMMEASRSVGARQAEAGVLKAGEALAAFAQALADGKDVERLGEAGQAAIQKIADGSNLTLDPDVDSYYAMDGVTVRMPELVVARAALHAAMKPALSRPDTMTPREAGQLVQAATRFDIALAAVQASLGSAVGGNADGRLQTALANARARFDDASAQLSRQAAALREDFASGRRPALRQADAEAAHGAFSAAVETLWQAVHSELVRLIEARIAGFEHGAWRDLAIAALGALLAFACALSFVRSIRNPLADLVATLRRHELNDYSQPVPHCEVGNEIGEIARAIDQGRVEAERSALALSAMDQSPSMLMITDPEEKIIFISAALQMLLRQLEPVFQAADPGFRVAGLIGQHIDAYRANGSLRRDLILDDGEVRKVRYDVGSEAIVVDMSYIRDDQGAAIGHTLLWRNVTAELQGEAEVAAVVEAARQGDFSARLQIEDADEQMQKLVAGINEINAVVDSATTEFAGALQAIAGGDLTSRVETAYRGRFADLKAAINETVDRLSETVATIQVTAADVGLAAREINMGADDLSKRTEEQASSLEETAATTEELAASVKASAQGSKDAARIADEAMRAAETGGAIAGQAVEAMARIESASQKISDIIRVIDDIAFQTNLLALNAAVEAARAGDAGKGFAVVASEVRTLAQRSSDAAKDISGLISSSNGEVEEGVKLVRQAGEQLSQILDASQKVASTIAEISAASGEQANGIDEMSQAVAHLDEMTQQNAALAEESAASAGALSGRIGQLNDLVAQFRTGREAQGQQAYAAPAYAAAGGGSARSAPRPAPRPAAPARPAPRPVAAQARPAGMAMQDGGGEPERLRQLAEAAFAQTKAAPAAKAAGGRAQDAGWEEF